ncbi:UDP-N-acetylmuramate:L-alanyl-gamma-D-glutamyl-meso-diaminopimelate ligase [Alteromonas sp. a30]|uniref:UDP-N-acetylmuramate:L-alanyl-gamma-D-glutamyl- meso-diaminopimelate ligase n=1 Tax=Alteromonas sp. a30 TaxID=2730917 RepID=UPI00227E850A|nr:UDP-N-acetylmuramate:L-alanyl-gamma-D-glutamyl-meso-diaminopimelate ligase [Alteromonas sp. a30]MCY7295341.1 UDP-N-acetylmuramate:L-alanyl-gamma-D-glutamyl-meso-diaminopimelate ligase [Alteromonas sp. a30]
MHIHILGICGTFMGGIAALAKALGHKVTGSDQQVYPPMSTQLEALGIELHTGYDIQQFEPRPDMVVVGNAMSRGNPAVEYVLDNKLPYTSGPQWLLDNLLKDRWVLAVSGTHGKTTCSSMLAWILEYCDMKPGFLIGGVPENFGISARLGDSPFFVIEADEYDTAFFDKRSKFVHYRPNTLVINNLEFDHADIFDTIHDIQRQFHHLLRMVPSNGLVLTPQGNNNVDAVLTQGLWCANEQIGREWTSKHKNDAGSEFDVYFNGELQGTVNWELIGQHNVDNALMAIAAARNVGVKPDFAIEALATFKSVKRRMEMLGEASGVTLYDDFAHHPTAIQTTLDGLRAKVGSERIVALLELRSNTMKSGYHKDTLVDSLAKADHTFIFKPGDQDWSLASLNQEANEVFNDMTLLKQAVKDYVQQGDHLLIMSNGGFGGIHKQLLNELQEK